MEVRFTELAVEDLRSIKKYIFENNKKAAKEVVANIIESIETIIVPNPSAGRTGRVLRTRELVITKYPYIVPYQVRYNVIYILRILHTSRKWEL
ncbi:MAG: type II toxin-antitoxin system RelE/ParE family toxin [Candidatus Gastranaerophilales bacterium]|nr:type II toxin-antitoxin system RelE/ParE family toxin [Candidatus Gastranaerophilales bacterium]